MKCYTKGHVVKFSNFREISVYNVEQEGLSHAKPFTSLRLMWIGPQLTRYLGRVFEIKRFDRSCSINYLEIFCCTSAVVNMTTMPNFEAILDSFNVYETCTSFCKRYFIKVK
jgi:hypothetical protein